MAALKRGSLTVGGVEFDLRLLATVMVATVLPMVYSYRFGPFDNRAYDQFLIFFVVPVLVTLLVFRENPTKYGLTFGNWREGLVWTLCICVCLAIGLWLIVKMRPEIGHWYKTREQASVLHMIWLSGVEMFAWEFLLRGFLLFAFARVLGPGPAIMLQMIPFALLHLGKPPIETFSTVFSGIGFGFIAWRCKSFVYPFLIHWFMLTFVVLGATGWFG